MIKAKTKEIVAEEITDILGNTVKIGDIIAYPTQGNFEFAIFLGVEKRTKEYVGIGNSYSIAYYNKWASGDWYSLYCKKISGCGDTTKVCRLFETKVKEYFEDRKVLLIQAPTYMLDNPKIQKIFELQCSIKDQMKNKTSKLKKKK